MRAESTGPIGQLVISMTRVVLVSVLMLPIAGAAQLKQSGPSKNSGAPKYDPKRDADKDVQDAVQQAKRTGKRVLLEVGGEWCSWCHTMDRFFEQNLSLVDLREKNYITVKINFSPENQNSRVLSRYPSIPGYPHIFILDQEGKLIHSQDTSKLEAGNSYDLNRFAAFLEKWAPK